jgi:hypothetical protein
MKEEVNALEQQIAELPKPILEIFHQAMEGVRGKFSDSELLEWTSLGVSISSLPVRSWDAVSAYFEATPTVSECLTTSDLISWGQTGNLLCKDSPALASVFFRSSKDALHLLQPSQINGWANLGLSLYTGTWKSSNLSARFFEGSAVLFRCMSYTEVEHLIAVFKMIASKSWDAAIESLEIALKVFPSMGVELSVFIDLMALVCDKNWREVKGCLEAAPQFSVAITEDYRSRFLKMAEQFVNSGVINISMFLRECSNNLRSVDHVNQGRLLSLSENISGISFESVMAFLHSGPKVLNRVNPQQMQDWFLAGLEILQRNLEGGLAYFRLQSSVSQKTLEKFTTAVDLEYVQNILGMYCRALAGANIDIVSTTELVAKNIGWVSEDSAATEGTTVYLPVSVDKYDTKEKNFTLLKVISTHQVAHIEFGSFDFGFDTPSNRFWNRRHGEYPCENDTPVIERDVVRKYKHHPHSMDINHSSRSSGKELQNDVARFFDLFSNRKLALDVFTAVEDSRLDFRVKYEYPGIAVIYKDVQGDTLLERPQISAMPAQEAMVEFLVRLSLQSGDAVSCPRVYLTEGRFISLVMQRLSHIDANVEDSAEATIRIYDLIANIPNEVLPENEWSEVGAKQPEMSINELEKLYEDLKDNRSPEDSLAQSDDSYNSPSQISYRGDFKPELTQLLRTLRIQQNLQMEDDPDSFSERIEDLLSSNIELEMGPKNAQLDTYLETFAQNIIKETRINQPAPGQKADSTTHEQDQGRPLESNEPKSFVYNEWDFRAADFKPRWCIVKEKYMAEGDVAFYSDTLQNYAHLALKIRRQFEMIMPETFRKIKHLSEGEEFDLDAVVESIVDRRSGVQPSDKLYWRRNKVQRDVSVVFLMDMSASTAESIDESSNMSHELDTPDDPRQYVAWLKGHRVDLKKRSSKRIIDLEKESIVLLINALESIGDTYGIYGFSGYGRDNVEFYVIKDIEESFGDVSKRRIDKITPLHATRMGPAIRHATSKLERQATRTKLLFLISDGRPQDRGYSREGVEKEYAVHDTKMALTEARHKGITPFCLTVDKSGHDYLKTMCQDMGYEILDNVSALPGRLPMLY